MSEQSRDSVEKMLRYLGSSDSYDELHAQYFSEILAAYFGLGRPSYFSQYKVQLFDTYLKILQHLPIEKSFSITHSFFLYVRTSNSTDGDLENQNEIKRYIFQPFKSNLEQILPSINVPALKFDPNEDTYLVMTRHATTQGMYAPGKQIYSVCDALLKFKKKVILVNFGNQDEKFSELRGRTNFSFLKFNGNYNSLQNFLPLRKLIDEIKPIEIITEIEISVINFIEAIGVSSKVCLLSSGIYQIPWFDKKYLTPELYSEEMKMREDAVKIPQTHNLEILAPSLAKVQIEQIRIDLDLQQKFVFGSFARYEMFTPKFLEFAKRALNSVPDSVLILAGSNDQSIAQSYLADEIQQKQAILFGVAKTHLLGWAIDVFLDPFPTVAGFAALESLAKGKPVVSKECPGLENYRRSRVQDLIFEEESDLLDTLISMAGCKKEYYKWSQKSKKLAQSFDNSTALATAIYYSSKPKNSLCQDTRNAI